MARQPTPLTLTPKAHVTLDYLASMPAGETTLLLNDLRSLLLCTDGTMMARGSLFDIISKRLGVGVYRVTLKRRFANA